VGVNADVIDLLAGAGRGPIWGDATGDLNLTLLAWPAGQGTPEHVNDERDVVIVVVDGRGLVTLDGDSRDVQAGHAVVCRRGTRRQLTAGPDGIRYLSVHLRRGGLDIAPPPTRR
jgi:quercetin dioxygenase-like cupin family protein